MSPRLISRSKQIPGGMQFHIAAIPTFKLHSFSSLSSAAQQIIAVRQANPYLTQKNNWSTVTSVVEDEVDQYNAKVCAAMGWTNYITDTGGSVSIPKAQTPQQSPSNIAAAAGVAKRLWAGLRTLNDWYDSREPAVPPEQSSARAKVCVACPKNKPGDLETWFTRPAAEAIKRQIQKFADRKLSTPDDAKLHTCEACLCINSLSVHAPLHLKLAHMTLDTRAALDPSCWVLAEEKASKS